MLSLSRTSQVSTDGCRSGTHTTTSAHSVVETVPLTETPLVIYCQRRRLHVVNKLPFDLSCSAYHLSRWTNTLYSAFFSRGGDAHVWQNGALNIEIYLLYREGASPIHVDSYHPDKILGFFSKRNPKYRRRLAMRVTNTGSV